MISEVFLQVYSSSESVGTKNLDYFWEVSPHKWDTGGGVSVPAESQKVGPNSIFFKVRNRFPLESFFFLILDGFYDLLADFWPLLLCYWQEHHDLFGEMY